MSFFDRTEILFGRDGLEKLSKARVAVYGLGGVGAACAMDLARAGVGSLYVVDFDVVEESNLNRLYFGYAQSIGKPKTQVFREFAESVNPEIRIDAAVRFFSGDEAESIVDRGASAHADCVDSLNSKVNLIAALSRSGAAFISSMGTAGRTRPELLKLGPLSETSGCPLARSVRTRLRRMGIASDFPTVWSDEPPVKPVRFDSRPADQGRQRLTQGSSPFVPQSAGHIMASWIVRRMIGE